MIFTWRKGSLLLYWMPAGIPVWLHSIKHYALFLLYTYHPWVAQEKHIHLSALFCAHNLPAFLLPEAIFVDKRFYRAEQEQIKPTWNQKKRREEKKKILRGWESILLCYGNTAYFSYTLFKDIKKKKGYVKCVGKSVWCVFCPLSLIIFVSSNALHTKWCSTC